MQVCLVNHCSQARLAAFWRYIRVTAPARSRSRSAASREYDFNIYDYLQARLAVSWR